MIKSEHTYETLEVGDSYTFTRFLSQEEVLTFAEVSGDDNPIHVDPEYVSEHTQFERPIVHGVFLLAVVSKVLGKDFPGYGSVAVSISSRFVRPVPVESEITVEVKVVEKIEKRKHIKVRTYVYCDGKMAMGGDAILVPPES